MINKAINNSNKLIANNNQCQYWIIFIPGSAFFLPIEDGKWFRFVVVNKGIGFIMGCVSNRTSLISIHLLRSLNVNVTFKQFANIP